MKPTRFLLRLVLAPAAYGLTAGAIHSSRYAALGCVKFPLLIGITALVCSASHYVVARFFGVRISLRDVRRLVVEGYGDLSVLLASFSTVLLFLALAFAPPRSLADLGEYPLFLSLNVGLVAACGALSLGRQAFALAHLHPISRRRARAIVVSWLTLSLVVGGQCAWFLRPFFGNRAAPSDGSFCLGTKPDFRGATSFYEAVADLFIAAKTAAPARSPSSS